MISLKRLGILYLPTCVGLGYGSHWLNLEAFLGSVESITLRGQASRHQFSVLNTRICLSVQPTTLNRDIHHPADLSSCVPPSHTNESTGILTCFPSTTPFGLALGAD